MNEHGGTVRIHGGEWKWDDIEDDVAACREQTWRRARWRPTPALVHKVGGTRTKYVGQRFDPEKTDLVPDGWTHEHCQICWWTLHETDVEDEGQGYTDGVGWVCLECYAQFLAPASGPGPAA